jgi:excisionase family DNA binding protein
MKLDPRLEAAYASGRTIQAKLRAAEGGSISSSQAASRLGISRTTLLSWYRTGKILGWRQGSAVRFPVWQFKGGRLLPGLAEVLEMANSGQALLDDDGRMLFLLSNLGVLSSRRPIDLLREGDVEGVKKSVSGYFGS